MTFLEVVQFLNGTVQFGAKKIRLLLVERSLVLFSSRLALGFIQRRLELSHTSRGFTRFASGITCLLQLSLQTILFLLQLLGSALSLCQLRENVRLVSLGCRQLLLELRVFLRQPPRLVATGRSLLRHFLRVFELVFQVINFRLQLRDELGLV